MSQAPVQDRSQAALFSLPPEIRELKQRAVAFVEREIRPVEEKVARTETIDPQDIAMLRTKARAAGFSMLNMPVRYGGKDIAMLAQVAIEEEAAGKSTIDATMSAVKLRHGAHGDIRLGWEAPWFMSAVKN